VQVNPIKPTLKAPGTKRLNPKCDGPVSNFAFKFNLHRYTSERRATYLHAKYAKVGWCRLPLSIPG